MSLRKFQIGDVVVVTDKISRYAQTGRGITPGMTGTVTGYNFQGYYTVKVENGQLIQEKSNAFTKGKPKSSIEMFTEQIENSLQTWILKLLVSTSMMMTKTTNWMCYERTNSTTG